MLNLQYQYRFLDVVIRKGEIAIWNKVRVASSQKLFRKKYHPEENPKLLAEQWIDGYWNEKLLINVENQNIVKGLQQTQDLRNHFIKDVFDLAEQYKKQWQQEVYFRFGITGGIGEGKSGKPNYQIESEGGQYTAIFRFSGVEFAKDGMEATEFIAENLSQRFSITELKHIWLVY